MAIGNYSRASHFYDIRELSGLPGAPEPGQKASRKHCTTGGSPGLYDFEFRFMRTQLELTLYGF